MGDCIPQVYQFIIQKDGEINKDVTKDTWGLHKMEKDIWGYYIEKRCV